MNLETTKYYLDLYTSTNDLSFRDAKTDIIKRIAVAGLIESGLMFTVEQGEIYLEGEIEGFQITDIYPYLSDKSKQKIIYAGAVRSLPQPQLQPESDIFSGEGMEDYDSSYESVDYTPDIPVVNPAELDQKKKEQEEKIINSKWQNAGKIEQQLEPATQQSVQQPVQEYSQPSVPQPQPEIRQPINEQPVQQTVPNQPIQQPIQQQPQPQSVQPQIKIATDDAEVLEISQNALSYEDCTIAITNLDTGENYRFGMKAYPLSNNLSEDAVIVRCNNLNKNSTFTQTKCGDIVTFDINNSFTITASRSENDIFEMDYRISSKRDEEISYDKINIKSGGQKGNLVITDDNLIIRIYPVNKGPSDKENEPIIYYINNYGNEIASSSKERKPEFEYDGNKYEIVSKWSRGVFTGSVIPVEV